MLAPIHCSKSIGSWRLKIRRHSSLLWVLTGFVSGCIGLLGATIACFLPCCTTFQSPVWACWVFPVVKAQFLFLGGVSGALVAVFRVVFGTCWGSLGAGVVSFWRFAVIWYRGGSLCWLWLAARSLAVGANPFWTGASPFLGSGLSCYETNLHDTRQNLVLFREGVWL
jgi:hypothetical protein